jgi:hypothetical protein
LTETGNTIILLSAGSSEYEADLTTYKMAKSYVYLTNINVSLVNFGNKTESVMKASLVDLNKNPIFDPKEAKKLKFLSLNCIERQIYLSPSSEELTVLKESFENKNHIYPSELKLASKERGAVLREFHHCDREKHYELREEQTEYLKTIK